MSQQGPIIVVSTAGRPSFATALDDAKIFPVIDTAWVDASRAIAQLQPAAVLVATSATAEPGFKALAKQIAAHKPYLPLIAVDPLISLPENAIPFAQSGGHFERLPARLLAALRIRIFMPPCCAGLTTTRRYERHSRTSIPLPAPPRC